MKKKFYTLILSVLSIQGIGQTITLDLSKNSFTQTIDPQTLKSIILLNKLADETKKYTIGIQKETIETPMFNINNYLGVGYDEKCISLISATQSLVEAKSENEIPILVGVLRKEIEKSKNDSCKILNEANQRINLTIDTCSLLKPIEIEVGEMVTITVKRDTITWTYLLKTEQISHWKTYYGFSYVLPSGLTHFDNFYAKQDTGSSYLITKSNQSTKYQLKNVTPTLMFTYLFFKKVNDPIKFGLTAGFQVDLNTPSVLFSPSLIIGDNISLNIGIAATQKYTLKGEYKLDQRIKENLNFEQLHDKIWTYDFFFSIAFRFEKNPFKKEETKILTLKSN